MAHFDFGQLTDLLAQPLWQYYISVALGTVPAARILMRAGFKLYPLLFLLVPWVGYIFCVAYLALQRWPVLKKNSPEKTAGAKA